MRRWWPLLALLMSLGVNLGLVTALVADRWRREPPLETAPPPPQQWPPGAAVERAAGRLGLEGEARERFLELERRYFEQARRGRQRMLEAREAVRRALLAPELDAVLVERLSTEAIAATADQDQAFVRHLVELKAVLTPQQFERYLVFITRARAAAGVVPARPPARRPWLRRKPGPPPNP